MAARMPDEDSLGTVMPTSRRIVQAPRDRIGEAVADLGQDISRVDDLKRREQAQDRAQNDSLDLARAGAAFNTRILNERAQYDLSKDPEYPTWGKKFGMNATKHLDSSASLIRNPLLREKFRLEKQDNITAHQIGVDESAHGIDVGKRRAEGLASIDANLSAATMPGLDPKESMRIVGETTTNIDRMVMSGMMTPEQGAEARINFTRNYASLRAGQDVDADPEQAAAWLRGGQKDGGAADLIRRFENFIPTPKWDVNHLRVGYGSDTITTADGTVLEVKPGMRVSRADAQRDLERRIGQFQGGVIQSIGEDRWRALNGSQQAALTSVAYNYGRLPKSVVDAVHTGNVGNIANAVQALGRDNDGINTKRRAEEAAIIRGSAGNKYASMAAPEYYSFLPPDKRDQLGSAADAQVAQMDKEAADVGDIERYQAGNLVENDIEQIKRTGQASNIDPNQVNRVLGPTATAKWLENRDTSVKTYEATSALQSMDDAQARAFVDKLEPKAGDPNFKQATEVYDAANAHAEKMIETRFRDPAASVETSSIIKKALERYDPEQPQSVQSLVRARYAAQSAIGIHSSMQQPITRAEAKRIIAPMQESLNMLDSARLMAVTESADRAVNRIKIKEIKDDAQKLMDDSYAAVEEKYGPYTPKVLGFALDEFAKERGHGELAAKVIDTIRKGNKAKTTDLQGLDALGETSQASKAVSGQLPEPVGSAPADLGQRPFANIGRGVGDITKMKTNIKSGTGTVQPSKRAVDYLISHPSTVAEFDRVYGAGAAEQHLPKVPH